MELSGHHFVAVFGGSVAGSEAAFQLAKRGFRVVVFEQNDLPYGKIEDGLPKWHTKLRDKEEGLIDEKLGQPNICYVPGVKLGRDIDFEDLVQHWGFSAVLIATGAWRDRGLPIPNINQFVNRGLVYQNPLVYWFNHYHEPGYQGMHYHIPDNALIVGGGLASLDIVKIAMIETVGRALAERGIATDMFKLERSIAKVLDENNLSMKDLGLKGCTLVYRRRGKDMPLSSFPKNTPEQLAKAQAINSKILDNFQSKYLFQFIPCSLPYDKIVEDDQLKGLVLQKTEVVGDVVKPIDEHFEFKTDMVISSIGSIPEQIQGMPTQGPLFKIADEKSCLVHGFENVFAVGNAVTGRGNIKESLEHGKETVVEIMDHCLHWGEQDYEKWLRGTEETISEQVGTIAEQIVRRKFLSDEVVASILDKTEALQKRAKYPGNYAEWIKAKTPIRYEEIIAGG